MEREWGSSPCAAIGRVRWLPPTDKPREGSPQALSQLAAGNHGALPYDLEANMAMTIISCSKCHVFGHALAMYVDKDGKVYCEEHKPEGAELIQAIVTESREIEL